MAPSRAFNLARVFAWLGLISVALILIGLVLASFLTFDKHDNTISAIGLLTVAISSLSLIVATIGTASTIMLGWRAERRQSEEFKLKIEQLELQLAEARQKAPRAG